MSQIPLLVVLAASSLSHAADLTTLKPGKYVTEGGDLTIARASDGTTRFELVSVSPWNGHTCGPMQGRIDHDVWRDSPDDSVRSPPCTVKFAPHGDTIEVTSNGEASNDECGSAVTFDGTYVALPRECDSTALTDARQRFKSAYDGKDFAKALRILQPAFARCASLLERSEADSMRNDLAITQYHVNDLEGCRRTLDPLREDAIKSDAELKSEYPAFALDARLQGIRAARVNLQLCSGSGSH